MSSESQQGPFPSPWPIMIVAAAIMMITTGARQSLGLYIAPLHGATGLGITEISLALAIGQFMWGASQPIFGAISDRYGPLWVIVAGSVMLTLGFASTPFMGTTAGLLGLAVSRASEAHARLTAAATGRRASQARSAAAWSAKPSDSW